MTVRAPTITIIDAARPRIRAWLWDIGLIVGFGTLMAAFARISIPLYPVPITGQTLGVLLTGALIGSRRGGLAMLVYLAEGLIGLPVFALGRSAWTPVGGLPVIIGPTAGYLFLLPHRGLRRRLAGRARVGSSVLALRARDAHRRGLDLLCWTALAGALCRVPADVGARPASIHPRRRHQADHRRRGAPFRLAPARGLPRRAASRLSDAVFQPLRGVRVLDLTVVWAGPMATMLLADLGAEVIKIENIHVWQTLARGALAHPPKLPPGPDSPGTYPNDEPGERPWNRAANSMNTLRNKRSVTIDLRVPEGRRSFDELVRTADVVYENNVTETVEKLGITYDVLRALRPDIIYVRAPAFASTGAYRNRRAFGVHLEGVTGAQPAPPISGSRSRQQHADLCRRLLRRHARRFRDDGGTHLPSPDGKRAADRVATGRSGDRHAGPIRHGLRAQRSAARVDRQSRFPWCRALRRLPLSR